jgi:hypothetical protein
MAQDISANGVQVVGGSNPPCPTNYHLLTQDRNDPTRVRASEDEDGRRIQVSNFRNAHRA